MSKEKIPDSAEYGLSEDGKLVFKDPDSGEWIEIDLDSKRIQKAARKNPEIADFVYKMKSLAYKIQKGEITEEGISALEEKQETKE